MTEHYQKGVVPPHIARRRQSIEDAIEIHAQVRRLEAKFFNQPPEEVEQAIQKYAERRRAELEGWEAQNA